MNAAKPEKNRPEATLRPFNVWPRSERGTTQLMANLTHTRGDVITVLVSSRESSLGIRPAVVSISPSLGAARSSKNLRREFYRGCTMVDAKSKSDRALVAKMVAGDATGYVALESRVQDCVWTTCLKMMGGKERLAREGFFVVWSELAATSFAKLKAWEGKQPLETFLTLTVRELLLEWSVRLFQEDGPSAKDVFLKLFDRLIRNCASRLHSQASDREDAYQAVLLELFEKDCRRLKAYAPPGNFANHVLVVVDRLLIDGLRGVIGRRRLPASIEKLSPLDRSVFSAIYWNEIPADADRLLRTIGKRHRLATRDDIDAARKRVQAALPAGYTPGRKTISIDAPTLSGEDGDEGTSIADILTDKEESDPLRNLLDVLDEKQLEAALAALRRAGAMLDNDEDKIYFKLFLNGVEKPREVAKVLGIPASQVYVIKERVHRRLTAFLANDPEVAAWRTNESEGE